VRDHGATLDADGFTTGEHAAGDGEGRIVADVYTHEDDPGTADAAR
jgi:hypothetical protein